MKILHAVAAWPPEARGGVGEYTRRLAEAQAAAGHAVLVAAGTSAARDEPGFRRASALGAAVDVRLLARRAPATAWERWDRGASPRLRRAFAELLEDCAPDVVHAHPSAGFGGAFARVAAGAGIPTVLTLHDAAVTCPRGDRVRPDDPRCERALSPAACLTCVPREDWETDAAVAERIERYADDAAAELARAAALLVPSEAHARFLCSVGGLEPARLTVVVPGSVVAGADADGREPWTPGCGRRLRVAHWGGLSPAGGAHVLLAAAAALERSDELELVLSGPAASEEYEAWLAELSEGLRLHRRDDRDADERASIEPDLCVFPGAAHTAHDRALEEALARGVPVLVGDRGARSEQAGRGGRSFPADDERALADLLALALDEDGFLASLRAALPAPRSMDEHARELEAVYERARAAGAPSGGDDADPEAGERLERALEETARDLAGLHAAAEREVASLRRDLTNAFAELQAGRAELAERAAEVRGLEARLAERDDRIGRGGDELRRLQAALDESRREVAQLESRVAEQTAERDTLVHALESRLVDLDREKSQVVAALEERRGAAQGLEAQLASLTASRDTVVNAMESRLHERAAELGQRDERIDKLESRIAELKSHIHDLDERILHKKAVTRDLESRAADQDVELQVLESRIAEEQRQHVELEHELAEEASRLREDLARVRRENTLALPLVLPVRGLLWLWDRLRGTPPSPPEPPDAP